MADELFSSRLIIKIDDLLKVHRVEKQRIEFKASWNTGGTSWQILHSITAFGNYFLNDNGGYIVIGVEDGPSDDGQVQVCGYPSRILTKYRNKFKHFVKETSDLYIIPSFLLRFTMRSMYLWSGLRQAIAALTNAERAPRESSSFTYEEDRKLLRLHRTKKDSYYWITIKHPSMTGLLGIQVRNQYFSIQFELWVQTFSHAFFPNATLHKLQV